MNTIPSAAEAKTLSDKSNADKNSELITTIVGSINKSTSRGEYNTTIYSAIPENILADLRQLGYIVTLMPENQLDSGPTWEIIWK